MAMAHHTTRTTRTEACRQACQEWDRWAPSEFHTVSKSASPIKVCGVNIDPSFSDTIFIIKR